MERRFDEFITELRRMLPQAQQVPTPHTSLDAEPEVDEELRPPVEGCPLLGYERGCRKGEGWSSSPMPPTT
ncbi:hypothetical protein Scep_027581 [Stephania cephalantha]|uniref:Uncharacterized protein n=1 Tax=Stephania cephalantha TaxID=152367 RepID=A0AAP0HIM7_9MAGN